MPHSPLSERPLRPYVERAATLILLWSELLDDTPAAEECGGAEDLAARRLLFRRDLRGWIERDRPSVATEKWVRAILEVVVDLDRRTWTGGVPTPPWQGRLHVTANAHFVLHPRSGERLGSLVVWSVRPA